MLVYMMAHCFQATSHLMGQCLVQVFMASLGLIEFTYNTATLTLKVNTPHAAPSACFWTGTMVHFHFRLRPRLFKRELQGKHFIKNITGTIKINLPYNAEFGSCSYGLSNGGVAKLPVHADHVNGERHAKHDYSWSHHKIWQFYLRSMVAQSDMLNFFVWCTSYNHI